MIKYVIFDLDQTLIDTSCADQDRKNRDWQTVYNKIPRMKMYPGISELIEFLNRSSIPYAIVTKSPKIYAEKVVRFFHISPTFIIGYFEVNKRKPDPEALHLVMKLFNHKRPSEVLHVGDDVCDIIASRAAGMVTIGAWWGLKDKCELESMKPDFLVSDPRELIEIIKNVN